MGGRLSLNGKKICHYTWQMDTAWISKNPGKKLAPFSKKTRVSLEALSFLNDKFLHYHNTYFYYYIANSHIILNTSDIESYLKIPVYFNKHFLLRLLLERRARQARYVTHAVTAPGDPAHRALPPQLRSPRSPQPQPTRGLSRAGKSHSFSLTIAQLSLVCDDLL